jgi:hypothetical protein
MEYANSRDAKPEDLVQIRVFKCVDFVGDYEVFIESAREVARGKEKKGE